MPEIDLRGGLHPPPACMRSVPILLSLLVLCLAMLLSIAVGSVFIPPADLWRVLTGQARRRMVAQAAAIILTLRLPRTALVLLTGAALGGSGAAYQGLFRNPLADPYLIGVASGAGLGAVLAMSLHWPYTTAGLLAVPAGGLRRRPGDRLPGLLPGPRRQDRPDHQPDPGGRGVQLLCHRPDLLPDAALHRRTAPRHCLAAGRRQRRRAGGRCWPSCPSCCSGWAACC